MALCPGLSGYFMRILQAGYVAFGYVMAKELRKKGIESDLLVPKQLILGKDGFSNDPKSLDPSLGNTFPKWIHFYDLDKTGWQFSVINRMRKYDLIHANMELPIFAMFSNKHYIAQSIGDDLRELAFSKSMKGYLIRNSYRRAKAFIYSWPPHLPFVRKLKLQNAMYIPWAWDTSIFGKEVKKRNENSEVLTIFHPLAQNWKMKGNEKFLKAFVRLCKEDKDVFLYYVDWGVDSQKAKKLFFHPKVKERIEIIQGPISREKMKEYMDKSDILADQFNSGSFTRTGMEAMVYGIPLLVNLDEEIFIELHGDCPPVISTKSDQVYQKLNELINSKEPLKNIGKKAREWAQKNYDLTSIIERYIEVYEKIVKN